MRNVDDYDSIIELIMQLVSENKSLTDVLSKNLDDILNLEFNDFVLRKSVNGKLNKSLIKNLLFNKFNNNVLKLIDEKILYGFLCDLYRYDNYIEVKKEINNIVNKIINNDEFIQKMNFSSFYC